MQRPHIIAIAVGVILALVTTATPVHAGGVTDAVQPQSGHGVGWYGVWGTGVNVRKDSSEQCNSFPGPGNCPTILTTVSAPEAVYVRCQKLGEWVAINPYWVFISVRGHRGWMASYYIDNDTNWIDGVPACT